MEIHNRFRYLREALGFYIRLLLCQMAAEVIVLLSSGAGSLAAAGMSQMEMMEVMMEMLGKNAYRMIVISYVLYAILLLLRKRKQQNQPLVLSDGLDKPVHTSDAFWGALMGMGGCLWSAILLELLSGAMTPFEAFVNRNTTTAPVAEPVWLQFVAIVLLAPFFEELIFRGLIFSRYRRIMHPMAAVFCQALTFASMHTGDLQAASALFMGVILGLAVMKSGSLRSAICIHLGFNLMTFFANPMYESIFAAQDTTKTVFAASAVVFVIGAFFFFRERKGTKTMQDK